MSARRTAPQPGTKRQRVSSRLGLVFALIAVPAVSALAVSQLSTAPITAEVVAASVSEFDSRAEGTVRWTDADGTRRTATLELTDEHLTTGTVPIQPAEGTGEVWVVEGPPILAMTMAAGVAALLVLVVFGTLRGYGYVRGTGRSGEMSTADVQESRGFYWRH